MRSSIPDAEVGLIEDAGYDVLAETARHEAIRDIGELGPPSVVVVQRILQDRLIRSPVDHRSLPVRRPPSQGSSIQTGSSRVRLSIAEVTPERPNGFGLPVLTSSTSALNFHLIRHNFQ